MIPTRDKELETASEQIQRDTAAFLKNGGNVSELGNNQTDYAKSGMHAYNNRTRKDAARRGRG